MQLHNREQDILDSGWVMKVYHSSRNGFLQARWTSVDPIGRPASGSRARVPPSNGFILQTFWDLLEIKLKPKGKKLLLIIELYTHSKQSDKPLNEWLTSIYNLVEVFDYPEDSKDRSIRDALIIGCSSDKAKDKIV